MTVKFDVLIIQAFLEDNADVALQKIEKASMVMLDRWQIEVVEDKLTDSGEVGDPIPYNIINNYFSVGVVSMTASNYHGR